jgi:hypothetical protein
VSFFAYPGKPCYLVPEACTLQTRTARAQDALASLDKLAAAASLRPRENALTLL